MKESLEQTYLFNWAAYKTCQYPELSLLFHVPNGGKRNYLEARALKRQGVKPGVPDLFLPVARGSHHGLFIELKVNKNKTSENQNKWIKKLKDQHYFVAVCYGWEEAKDVIENYLSQPKSI